MNCAMLAMVVTRLLSRFEGDRAKKAAVKRLVRKRGPRGGGPMSDMLVQSRRGGLQFTKESLRPALASSTSRVRRRFESTVHAELSPCFHEFRSSAVVLEPSVTNA